MKPKRFKGSVFATLFFFIALFSPALILAEKVPVVASIFPVADMIQQVGSPYVDVTFIIPAGASPHTFEPKPSQIKKIAAARVFFMIGAGLEIWAEKFMAAAGKDLLTVTLSDGVDLIRSTEAAHEHDADQPGSNMRQTKPDHTDSGAVIANPHIWLDPVIAQSMVTRIVAVLCSVDENHADHYRRQGEVYLKSLVKLDQDIRLAVSGFALKKYVAFHAAWDYFARHYGLEPVGIIETAPGRNPTPKRIKQIIADIKKYNLRAVFVEPQLNPKVAVVIAKEANVHVLLLDPMGAPTIKGRRSYLELMRYNLDVLKEAMQ
ncbi:MAG: metal ABC transporter substrate-binding protein [Desulfobacterales bacterium]|nr:metal ABC transporter substrate-binding protein [Desulfobacterales bacterium]